MSIILQIEFKDYIPHIIINEQNNNKLIEMSQKEAHTKLQNIETILKNFGAKIDNDNNISFNEQFCTNYSENYYKEFLKYVSSLSLYEFSFGIENSINDLNNKYLLLNDVYIYSETLNCSTINFSKLIQSRFLDEKNLLKQYQIVKIMNMF